jgi:hypothetical protein
MASTGNITFSKSFSQPTLQGGSLAFPLSSANQVLDYVEGITKYVFYTSAPASGVPIAVGGQAVIVRGVPLNLLQSVSLSGGVTWCLKGSAIITTFPYIVAGLSWANTSNALPSTAFSEIRMVCENTATIILPVYTGGTAVLKYTINLTID